MDIHGSEKITVLMNNPKKDHIVDVAEQLFAQNGYHGVSVRDITSAAGVRLASVNYYFGTKENLYFEVLSRRGNYIFNERPRRLAEIEFDNLEERQAIAQICHAIVDPMLEKVMTNDPGWRAFCNVTARILTSPLAKHQEPPKMDEYDKLSLDLIGALQRYTRDDDERKAHQAFQFISGASLTLISNSERMETLSGGKYRSDDYQHLYQSMMDFVIGAATAMLLSD